MTDREKVIYDIERCISHVPDACRDCSHFDTTQDDCIHCMEELLGEAIELLKEQEPIKIKRPERLDEIYDYMAYCPECHMQWVMYDSEKMRYCPGCGRKVKWNA